MDVHGADGGGAGADAPVRTPNPIDSALKRVVDVVVSALTLVLTLPIIVVAAVAIRLDSAGPVIVRHVRVGRGGARFELYRFRSTVHDAEQVTRVGRVLRRSSIDELPQMWNVLRGDMSLVGPRPASPDDTVDESAAVDVPRLRPAPGLTGTWSEADDSWLGPACGPPSNRDEPPEHDGPDYRAG